MPVGAAIVGSAAIGATASHLSSKSAAKTAANASNYAADQNAAVSREIYQQTRQDLSPYSQAGQSALPALMQRLGGGASGGGQAPAPGAPQGLQPGSDAYWDAYGAANPDLQQEWGRIGGRDPRFQDDDDYFRWHYENMGQGEGRALPQTQAAPAPKTGNAGVSPAVDDSPTAANPPTDLMTAQRPDASPAPTFQRPEEVAPPSFQFNDPGAYQAFSFDASRIAEDLGYQFRQREAMNQVNAGFGARGLLKSGGALKGALQRSSDLASQETANAFARQMAAWQGNQANHNQNRNFLRGAFEGDRSYGTNLWQLQQGRRDGQFSEDRAFGTDAYRWGQNRQDNLFSEDRGYQTQRYDQGTANLFNLANMGQSAAAGTANAGNIFAQNTINSNNQRAATTANAAIAGAQNMNNLVGMGMQAVGLYGGAKGWF